MPLPSTAQTSAFYQLISGAMAASDRAYGSIDEFFRSEFNNYFTGAQWRSILGVAEENMSGNYTQMIGKINMPVMASYVARDGEAPLISGEGFELSTKTMPTMKLAYAYNDKSIRDQARFLNNGSPDFGRVFRSFLKDSTELIAGIHTQLSYTALQIESTGKYLSTQSNNGGGLRGLLFDFQVPAANKKNAGGYGTKGVKKVWTDTTAYPIGDLQDMVQYADDNMTMNTASAVFRMNKKQWNLLINHPTTKAAVQIQVTNGAIDNSNIGKFAVTEAQIKAYLSGLGLPPVEIVNWNAIHQALNVDTQKIDKSPLSAFADDTVLLRPAGNFGELQWQAPTTLFATSANPKYVTDGGMIGVQQIINSESESMKFTADFTGIAVPKDVTSMLYLTTNVAAE